MSTRGRRESRHRSHPEARPAGRPGSPQATRRPPAAERDDTLRIWGTHAVDAALANASRTILRLYLTENAEQRLSGRLKHGQVEAMRVAPRDLDRLVGPDAVHQGAVAEVEPLPETDLESLVETAASGGGPLVILDQVTDPHNVGAIMRSAAVFGASGLVMTRRHSPPLAGVLAKTASGALELVPVALVPNLARALDQLADLGVTRIGLDGEGGHLVQTELFPNPSAIVLGAEGKGLRRLTRESCDRLCRIGATSALASLNVSNAAAVALYAASLLRSTQ